MKILSVEEAKDFEVTKAGRITKISAMAAALKVGQALIITRADWNSKRHPIPSSTAWLKKTGRVFEKGRLPDGSG